jgi:excisionase family DNA binding protein
MPSTVIGGSFDRDGPRVATEDTVSLDALAADPRRAAAVSPSAAGELLAQLAGLQSLLLSRLLVVEVQSSSPRPPDDRLLTIPEVAERLSVPPAYAYELARRGELPTVRVGRKYIRVPLSAFEKWLAVQQLDSRQTPAYSARHRRG